MSNSNTTSADTAKSASSTTAVAVIITRHHAAVMDPPVPLLEPLLEYRCRKFVSGGPTGFRQIEETKTLCVFDIKGRLVFPAGLLSRMQAALQEQGYEVAVEDQRQPGPRFSLDQDVLEQCTADERALLHAVVQNPQGQIEVAARKEVMNRCILLSRAFPKARCVVAVATREQAWKRWRGLTRSLGEDVGLALSGVNRKGKRWLVSTFGSVPRDTAGVWDILLLPEAEQATGAVAVEMVASRAFPRVYAFVRPQRRADRFVQLRMEQIAGPVLHRLVKPRAEVRVIFLPAPSSSVASSDTALERKRALYWHNPVRNEYVARVAQAVVAGNQAELHRLGLCDRDCQFLLQGNRRKIVLLVESPEHGRALLQQLPEWRLRDLVPDTVKEIETDKQEEINRRPSIVTAVYAGKNHVPADVLIRATGTEWPLHLKGFPHRRNGSYAAEVVVLDFDDNVGSQARQDTQRRRDDYQRRGMTVTTATGVTMKR